MNAFISGPFLLGLLCSVVSLLDWLRLIRPKVSVDTCTFLIRLVVVVVVAVVRLLEVRDPARGLVGLRTGEWLGAWLELRLLTGDREEWGVAEEDRFNGVEESVF